MGAKISAMDQSLELCRGQFCLITLVIYTPQYHAPVHGHLIINYKLNHPIGINFFRAPLPYT